MSSGSGILRSIIPVAAAIATVVFAPAGWATWAVYAAAATASMVASLAVNAIFPVAKPDLSFDYDFGDYSTEQTRVVRQAISFRRIIYGKCRVGGVYTFIESTKEAVASGAAQIAGNTYLHMLVTIAGHSVEGIDDIYIFDETETFNPTTHISTGPNYTNLAWCWTGDGTTAGDASLLAALKAACPSTWTAAHKQEGCAKVYLKYKYDQNAYKSGLPQPSFVVRGKKLYDPRTDTTAYSANAALCIRDYLNSFLGLNVATAKLPATEWSAEANICDEDVALAAGGTENRYECNGVVDLDTAPKKIIQALLTACAGRLVYTSGQWLLYVGAYRTPTVTLTLDDLDGPIKIASRVSRRDLTNGVKGTYVDPDQSWQSTDFPAVQVAAYVTEDQGEEFWKDIAMAYTTSGSAAQRIARVELERGRRQITVNLSCKLSAYQCMTAETVMFTASRYGWDAKVFEVMSWGFTLRNADDGAPSLGIDLTLRETDSGVFSWTSAQEQTINVAPATNLPNPSFVDPPTNLVVDESLYETRAGRGVGAKATLTWTASPDGFAVEYEVEHQLSGGEWIADGRPRDASAEILDLAPGLYVFRVRARNSRGAASTWLQHTQSIFGLSAKPVNVSGLTLNVVGGLAMLSWDRATDLDVRIGGRVRIRHSPETDGSATWTSSVDIGLAIPGTATNATLPAVSGTYLAKFVDSDTPGNESETAAAAITTAPSLVSFNAVETLDEAGDGFLGSKTDMYIADDGSLRLAGTDGMDDWTDFDAVLDFDLGEGGIAASGSYAFADTVDLGAVYTSRVTAALTFLGFDLYDLFDSRTEDIDDWADFDGDFFTDVYAKISVRTTQDDPAGTPTWTEWTGFYVGDYTARGFQFKLECSRDDASHQIAVSELEVTIDMPDQVRGEKGLSIADTGSSVVFPVAFKASPVVAITISDMEEGDAPVLENVTATGFDWSVTNSGSGVARTGNYLAQGY